MILAPPFPPPERITQRFRLPSAPGASDGHNGVDIGAPVGTPLHALSSGVVTASGAFPPSPASGNVVIADADDGRTSWSFSHLSRVFVRPGQRIEIGDVVGLVGLTGETTGGHVHIRVSSGSTTIDPMSLIDESIFQPGRNLDPGSSLFWPVAVVAVGGFVWWRRFA